MRNTFGILSLAIILAGGCGGRANVNVVDPNPESEPAIVDQVIADEAQISSFAGATFVSVDPLNDDGTAINRSPNTSRTLSFTTEAVTHNDNNGTETGTYSNLDGSDWVANFVSGSVNFSEGNDSIIWDGITYQRVATSLFDSRQSMINFFNGATYKTLGRFDVGENAFGGVALGQWSVQFADNQIVWSVQDTVSIGTFSFIDGSSFSIDVSFQELTAYVLNDKQLIIDSIVYQRVDGNQLDSQQTLNAFLADVSYQ